MYWPNPSDFSRMLQTPQVAFKLAELKACQIEKNSIGQPKARSGNFASVYRGIRPDGSSLAIRVFNLGRDERRERYEAISRYLQSRSLNSLVGFEFHESGVRSASDGKFYPLVTMQWVQGETLFDWLRDRCERHEEQAIEALAERWIELIGELERHQIAHGDLQHGNVMVTPDGQLKLVDYDCMCVPELVGRRNLETGLEPYQHPSRDEKTLLSSDLDRFSSLFIYTVLRALAAAPRLWQRYVADADYDKLLLRTSDFRNPEASALRRDLLNSPDEQVRDLLQRLIEAFGQPPQATPALGELLNPFDEVRQLLAERDWDAALALLQRKGLANRVPAELQGQVREAVDRVSCRRALEQAVATGNEVDMQRHYLPGLLDDYPAAQEAVAVARRAAEVLGVLRQLQESQQQKNWSQFVQTWDFYEPLLAGRKSAERFAGDVQSWRKRNHWFNLVRGMLQREEVDTAALHQAWRKLVAAGGHPDAVPLAPRIKRLIAREVAWRKLRKFHGDHSEEADRGFLKTWDDELFTGWTKAERLRAGLRAAQTRLQAISRVRAVVGQWAGHFCREGEQAIVDAARDLPAHYDHQLRLRVHQATARMKALRDLEAALGEGGPEVEIVRTGRLLLLADGGDLLDDAQRQRVQLAERRLPVLAQLASISPQLPVDQRDRRVLQTWLDDLLADCRDARPARALYVAALQRKRLIDRLQVAISAGDDQQLAEAADDPLLIDYPLPGTWHGPIQLARQRRDQAQALCEAVRQGNEASFVAGFDVQLLRGFPDRLQGCQRQLRALAERHLRPCEAIGLRPAFRSPLVWLDTQRICLRWAWPAGRFGDECLLTITARQPTADDDPEAMGVLYRVRLDRRAWNTSCGCHVLPFQDKWQGAWAAAWAVLPLVGDPPDGPPLFSQPLVLGRVEPPGSRGKWWKRR